MSDMHVLMGDGENYSVVMHFPVPPGTNLSGVPWRDALKASLPTTVMVEGTEKWEITTVEKTGIEAGTILERVVRVGIEPGRDTLEKVTRALRHAYKREKAELQPVMGRRFRIYGMTESEA